MARDPADLAYLPWFPRDWFASEAFLSLDLEAQGAYRNLIDRCWCSSTCSIPGDDGSLARMSGAKPRQWMRVRAAVLANFAEQPDGTLRNDRIYREWLDATERRSAKQMGAAKTNAILGRRTTRIYTESERSPTRLANAERHAQRDDIVSPPSPSPSPSPKQQQPQTRADARPGAAAASDSPPGPEPLGPRLAARIRWPDVALVERMLTELRSEGDSEPFLEARYAATREGRCTPFDWAKATRKARTAAKLTDDERIATERHAESWSKKAREFEAEGDRLKADGAWAQVEFDAKLLGRKLEDFGWKAPVVLIRTANCDRGRRVPMTMRRPPPPESVAVRVDLT